MIKTNLPWCLNIAMVALRFFWLGNLGRENLIREEEITISFRGLLVAVILIGAYLLLCPVWDNHINMASCAYGNVLGFEVLSMIGITGLVMLCKSLIINRIWGGLGRNTLIIFALHQPLLRIVRFVGAKIPGAVSVETSILYAILADAIVLLCLVPLIWIWNKNVQLWLKKLYIK